MSGQLTPRPLNRLGKMLLYPLNIGLGRPQVRAVWTMERKISRFCPGCRSLDVYRAHFTAFVSGSSLRFTKTTYEHRENKCPAIYTYLLTYSLLPPIPVLCEECQKKGIENVWTSQFSEVDVER